MKWIISLFVLWFRGFLFIVGRHKKKHVCLSILGHRANIYRPFVLSELIKHVHFFSLSFQKSNITLRTGIIFVNYATIHRKLKDLRNFQMRTTGAIYYSASKSTWFHPMKTSKRRHKGKQKTFFLFRFTASLFMFSCWSKDMNKLFQYCILKHERLYAQEVQRICRIKWKRNRKWWSPYHGQTLDKFSKVCVWFITFKKKRWKPRRTIHVRRSAKIFCGFG